MLYDRSDRRNDALVRFERQKPSELPATKGRVQVTICPFYGAIEKNF
ncbi:hypothetical protein CA13_53010 [Planctomycetes bacterium CA13]|uniref:Uncharacterized protein n=1 Tax=Novipirellula herctigrandis TaxID=2527986 RepID=A0A5C5Z8Y6_9BACT|nr:hypothetical protein CA13_53010 [Planctomycetes bacterium CA13]